MLHTLRLTALIGVLCFQSTTVQAQTSADVEYGLLPAVLISGREAPGFSIYDRMRHYNVPGVSIAVVSDSRIDWAQGYGVKVAGGTDSVTALTLFQAASISKPVAAAGALRLVDEGRLDLDADVSKILKSWKLPENSFTEGHPVTLRGLLSHTAGLTVHGFPGYARGEDIPKTVGVLDGSGNTPAVVADTMPGAIWRYSGGGYTVAQLLVEEVTGRSFADAMQRSILDPMGMNGSTYAQPLPDSLAGDVAAAHGWDGSVIDGLWHTYPEGAAAGLWTIPTDLARFALGITSAYRGERDAVITQPAATQMLTPHLTDDYGLGLGIVGEGDALRFSHGGSNAGYRCYFVMYPRTGDGAVVMTNADGGADLTMEIIRAVSDAYDWPDFKPEARVPADIDPSTLRAYEGEYEVEPGIFVTLRPSEEGLLATATRRFPTSLAPESDRVFFGTDINMRIRFEVDAAGAVQGFVILRGDNEIQARKIR